MNNRAGEARESKTWEGGGGFAIAVSLSLLVHAAFALLALEAPSLPPVPALPAPIEISLAPPTTPPVAPDPRVMQHYPRTRPRPAALKKRAVPNKLRARSSGPSRATRAPRALATGAASIPTPRYDGPVAVPALPLPASHPLAAFTLPRPEGEIPPLVTDPRGEGIPDGTGAGASTGGGTGTGGGSAGDADSGGGGGRSPGFGGIGANGRSRAGQAPAPARPPALVLPRPAPTPATPARPDPEPPLAERSALPPPQPEPQRATEPPALTQPRYRHNPPPDYPRDARRDRKEGTVRLLVSVNTKGSVDQAEVTQSSGTPSLDAAAREAVLRWTFEPGRRGDIPVACRVTVPIHFRLD